MSSARNQRMKKMAMLVLSLALVLTGCAAASAESGDQVTLTAARAGQKVMLTLRNGTAAPVGYNLCSSTLQRRWESWEAVKTDEVCTMEIRTLEPGGSATFEKTLPSDPRSGEYRYVTNVGVENKGVMVESNPFRVD